MRELFFPAAHMIKMEEQIRKQIGEAIPVYGSNVGITKEEIEFVESVCALTEEEAAARAYDFTLKECAVMLRFLGYNKKDILVNNLLTILGKRRGASLFHLLFQSWKNNYFCKQYRFLLSQYFDSDDGCAVAAKYNLTKEIFDVWNYRDGDFGFGIALYLKNRNYPIGRLNDWQITTSDRLYYAVQQSQYLICEQEQYWCVTPQLLLNALGGYTQEKLAVFLENFVYPLPDRKYLDGYASICRWYSQRYLPDGNKKNTSMIWNNLSESAKKNFKKWQMLLHINDAFGKDERSKFWAEYIDVLEDVRINKVGVEHFQIALLFDGFSVIDFTEVGYAGRIISQSDYHKYLRPCFEGYRHYKNDEIRNMITEKMRSERIVHSIDWRIKTVNMVRKWQGRSNAGKNT